MPAGLGSENPLEPVLDAIPPRGVENEKPPADVVAGADVEAAKLKPPAAVYDTKMYGWVIV